MSGLMEPTTKALAALQTEPEKLAFLDGYKHGLREANATWDAALAAATGTAKTPQAVECEASHSGPNASEGNAQPKNVEPKP